MGAARTLEFHIRTYTQTRTGGSSTKNQFSPAGSVRYDIDPMAQRRQRRLVAQSGGSCRDILAADRWSASRAIKYFLLQQAQSRGYRGHKDQNNSSRASEMRRARFKTGLQSH